MNTTTYHNYIILRLYWGWTIYPVICWRFIIINYQFEGFPLANRISVNANYRIVGNVDLTNKKRDDRIDGSQGICLFLDVVVSQDESWIHQMETPFVKDISSYIFHCCKEKSHNPWIIRGRGKLACWHIHTWNDSNYTIQKHYPQDPCMVYFPRCTIISSQM